MQVNGLACVQVLMLESSRINTQVEYTSVQHKPNTMAHETRSNRQVESCDSCDKFKLLQEFFQILEKFSQFTEKSQVALATALLGSNNLHLSGTICTMFTAYLLYFKGKLHITNVSYLVPFLTVVHLKINLGSRAVFYLKCTISKMPLISFISGK